MPPCSYRSIHRRRSKQAAYDEAAFFRRHLFSPRADAALLARPRGEVYDSDGADRGGAVASTLLVHDGNRGLSASALAAESTSGLVSLSHYSRGMLQARVLIA